MSNTSKLIIAITIPLLIGFIGGGFTASEIPGWYAKLNKPGWQPPNWLFGPVWTALYILMGIALYLVWKADVSSSKKQTAIILFAVQLILNFFWSIIFFNQHQIGWALVEIIVLWLFILLTIFSFSKINNTAAWLLVPYISWVSFATILNYAIWKLNTAPLP